ncbi:hypothetical protein FRB94_005683 [Tulasnella sp. JGI-2019a]|nr:hypothetical protein FRB94_005683 [Tulasnella sp. JGI-2019a]KAG9006306.1 hypothetical protein FRB93_008795 [Tulasnella sp. JGI-2019a]
MGPPITLFLTTIASEVNLRRRQEYLLRTFQIKKIPFQAYDMASDEQARRLWKRKVPPAKQQLPGLLIDNTFVGTVEEFEAAVEQGEAQLRKFLRLDEAYNADVERLYNTPAPEVVPIGVPGVQMPSEISGHKTVFHGPKDKPIDKSKIVKHDKKLAEGEIDLTESLGGFGLEGVIVTEDELLELIASLGLEEKHADELAKGIFGAGRDTTAAAQQSKPSKPAAAQAPAPEHAPAPVPPTTTPPVPAIKTTTPASPDRTSPTAPKPTSAITPSKDSKSLSQIPVPTSVSASSVPPSPIVTVSEAPPSTSSSSLSPQPEQIVSSPGALSPINENSSTSAPTGIMASHEIMSELAKRVGDYNAKRRTRTDAKPKRLPSLSNISETNSPVVTSPMINSPSMEFPTSPIPVSPGGLQTPIRQRKSSMFGKPTLPPSPMLSPGGATSPLDMTGSRIPRSRTTSSSTPPVVAVPVIKTPVRTRKQSAYKEKDVVKVAFPVTEGGGDGPLPETLDAKSPSRKDSRV